MTRIAAWIGVVFFLFLCWLAISGVTILVPLLVTAVALVVLIAGGSWLKGPPARRPPARGPGEDPPS